MLTKTKMQEIQDLKLQGYTKADIIRYYEAQGRKPPSRPTISKYYDMDVLPDDSGAKLAKPKTFDAEPFRSTIISILETNSGRSFCMSSVYDVLEEKFIENGDYEKLPGTSRRSATISTILRIPDRSTGNRSIVVSMIMFLTPRPENRC